MAQPKFLYKYRGGLFERDLEALEKSFIWAAEPETLNDPFEATIVLGKNQLVTLDLLTSGLIRMGSKGEHDRRPEHKSFLDALTDFVEKAKKWGIFSGAQSAFDELSWAHYAHAHQGFCIEYDLNRLQRRQLRAERLLQVEYHERPPLIDPSMLFGKAADDDFLRLTTGLVATKSIAWTHGKEWRIVAGLPGRKSHDPRAVVGIYFGYRMPEEEKRKLMSRLKGRGISYSQMHLVPNAYELKAEPVVDPFHVPGPTIEDLQRINIEDWMIYASGDLEPLREALASLARWQIATDPECESVVNVTLGTASNLFFVTCSHPSGDPLKVKNVYYTREQVLQIHESIQAGTVPDPKKFPPADEKGAVG